MSIQPFTIAIEQATLDDLRERLARTRWHDEVENDGLQSPPQLSGGQYIEVPAGVATFPKDLTYPPRELGERFLRIARWTEMPRGGHFAALEVPKMLAEDIRAFLRPLRSHEITEQGS